MEFPIHPAIVHFPIGLYFLELVFLFFGFLKKEEFYKNAARFTFRVAFLAMIAALISGWLQVGSWEHI